MTAETEAGYPLQGLNIDRTIESGMRFFASLGFSERLSQYEMLKRI